MIAFYYPVFVFVHIVTGAMYVVTMIIMQLVVGNMMKRVSPGEGKDAAVQFLRARWHPIVDVVIILVGVSGGFIAYSNWEMIGQNKTLQLKLFFGTLSLMAAYANHFFFRYLKRSLVSSGRNPSLLQGVNLITAVFDKVALVCGVIAALSGVGLNHL